MTRKSSVTKTKLKPEVMNYDNYYYVPEGADTKVVFHAKNINYATNNNWMF